MQVPDHHAGVLLQGDVGEDRQRGLDMRREQPHMQQVAGVDEVGVVVGAAAGGGPGLRPADREACWCGLPS